MMFHGTLISEVPDNLGHLAEPREQGISDAAVNLLVPWPRLPWAGKRPVFPDPMDPSIFLGSVWGIIYYNLEA